jgi:hypothetical protein
MILDDGDRAMSPSAPHPTILLHDYHLEYGSVLGRVSMYDETTGITDRQKTSSFVRCEVVWDQYNIIDLIAKLNNLPEGEAEDVAETIRRHIFPGSQFDDWDYHIWQLHGTLLGLGRAFEALYAALDVPEGVGGDDDAFDYWPNTVDMLLEFARDLDALTSMRMRVPRVMELVDRVLDRSCHRTHFSGRPMTAEESDEQRQLLTDEWGYPGRWAE